MDTRLDVEPQRKKRAVKRRIGTRGLAAVILSLVALFAVTAGTSGATVSPTGSVTRTFSFIGKPNSATRTLISVNSLLINARRDARGNPVIFAFSSATHADLFGRIFDGLGRIHIVRNSSFTNKLKGVSLSTSSGDFDATGTVLFETSSGKVVTVNYAFDNATTLGKLDVCTVYGSFVAS